MIRQTDLEQGESSVAPLLGLRADLRRFLSGTSSPTPLTEVGGAAPSDSNLFVCWATCGVVHDQMPQMSARVSRMARVRD